MKMKLRSLLVAAFLTVCVSAGVASAQGTQATASYDPLSALPTSNIVAFANMQRILVEIVPRLMMKDPAMLLKMTTALNDVYEKTGINLLSIDRVAAGLQFIGPANHQMKKENLGIAIIVHGDFNADKLIAFLKKETNNKGSQESYGGKTIHIEPRPAPPAVKTDRQTAAYTFLDDHTIVIGDLPQVRAAIDAASGKGRVDSTLVQLATRDPNSLIGLAGNVPPELIKDLQSTVSNDPTEQAISKLLTGLKQVFASFGATQTEFDATTGARFETEAEAQSISDLLLGLRQQAAANVDVQELRELISAVQVTAQGDQVQIKASVPTSDVQNFVAMTMRDEKPTVEPKKPEPVTAVKTVSKPTTTTKHRRSKKRRGR
jgi:hypothetical protein